MSVAVSAHKWKARGINQMSAGKSFKWEPKLLVASRENILAYDEYLEIDIKCDIWNNPYPV